MQITKKIILGLSIFFSMLIALVIGISKLDTKIEAPELTEAMVIGVQEGGVTIEKGDDEIHFEYDPQVNAGAVTKAYEYLFTNPMSVSTAIGIKPITIPSGVTVAYKVSSSKLSASSLTSGSSSFTTTTISAGSKMYAYVIVTASSASTALSFTSSVTWYYGKAASLNVRIYNSFGEDYSSKTFMYGQYVYESDMEIVALEDFDYSWFSNSTCTTAITFPFRWQGESLYGVAIEDIQMIMSADCMSYHDGGYCYRYYDGSPAIEIPEYYYTSTYGLAKVTHIHDNVCNANSVYGTENIEYILIPHTIVSIGEYAFFNCNEGNPITVNIYANNLETIGSYAFASLDENSSGTVIFNIGSLPALTRIEDYAFQGSDNVFDSGDWLADCSSLQYIGDYVFHGVYVESLTIPAKVEWIGYKAIYCEFASSYNNYNLALNYLTFKDTTTWYYSSNATNWLNKTGGASRSYGSNASTNAALYASDYGARMYKL